LASDGVFEGFKNGPSWFHGIKAVIEAPLPVIENDMRIFNAALNRVYNIIGCFDKVLISWRNYQEPKIVRMLVDKPNHMFGWPGTWFQVHCFIFIAL
jgi:hypothetical protein